MWQGVVVGEEELSVSRGQRHRVFFSVFQSHPGLDVDRRPKEVWEIPFGYRVPLRAYRPKETNSLVVCFLGIPISPILTDHAAISEVPGSSLFPENGQKHVHVPDNKQGHKVRRPNMGHHLFWPCFLFGKWTLFCGR